MLQMSVRIPQGFKINTARGCNRAERASAYSAVWQVALVNLSPQAKYDEITRPQTQRICKERCHDA